MGVGGVGRGMGGWRRERRDKSVAGVGEGTGGGRSEGASVNGQGVAVPVYPARADVRTAGRRR